MRPDIAQAIHDAAVSELDDSLDAVAIEILSEAFVSINEWFVAHRSKERGFPEWLCTDEGRTYMLLVAEALS